MLWVMLTFAFVVRKFSLLPFFMRAEKHRWAGKAENEGEEAFRSGEDFYEPARVHAVSPVCNVAQSVAATLVDTCC